MYEHTFLERGYVSDLNIGSGLTYERMDSQTFHGIPTISHNGFRGALYCSLAFNFKAPDGVIAIAAV